MNNQNQAPRPFMAAAFGLAIGAAVGALAVVFSDPSNRQRLRRGVQDLDKATRNQLTELQKMIVQAEKDGRKKLADNLKTAANQLEKGK